MCKISDYITFVPLTTDAPSIFSFSEFLAALALMVLAWTLADLRYRLRVAIAPFALRETTYFIIVALGLLTLLTDLWRAEEWLVIKGSFFTPSIWQAFLGALFLFTFLSWAWFAFIKPPIFGKRNAKRFYSKAYKIVVSGSSNELSILATELGRSYSSIIEHAKERVPPTVADDKDKQAKKKKPSSEDYANEVLLLIADKRLCRMIVESGAGDLISLFETISSLQKYRIPVSIFAKNITEAALINKDSFIYHESEGYETGTLGFDRPLSQTLYGDFNRLEGIGSQLDVWPTQVHHWDAQSWEAYCRITLIAIKGQLDANYWQHAYSTYRALSHIESACSDLFKLNGQENIEHYDDLLQRLRAVTNFAKDCLKLLDATKIPQWVIAEKRDRKTRGGSTLLDYIAKLMEEVISQASYIREPFSTCWSIQRNTVWSSFFSTFGEMGQATDIVLFKVRRRLYNRIVEMKEWPNYHGGKILGICLNVSMLNEHCQKSHTQEYPIFRATLKWCKKHLARIHEQNPKVFKECFPARLKYDDKNHRLVYTFDPNAFRTEPKHVYFTVDQANES